MPEQVSEQVREQIVALRREGRTYSQLVEATGASRGTVAEVLKAAGLAQAGNRLRRGPSAAASPAADPAPAAAAGGVRTAPVVADDGVEEFVAPKPVPERVSGRFACESCGAVMAFEEEPMIKECPECGGVF